MGELLQLKLALDDTTKARDFQLPITDCRLPIQTWLIGNPKFPIGNSIDSTRILRSSRSHPVFPGFTKSERNNLMCPSMRSRLAAAISLLACGVFLLQSAPLTLAQTATAGAAQKMIKPLSYPSARKSDQVDDY